VKQLLGHPEIYHALQRALGAFRAREIMVRDYLPAGNQKRILDIGCGPGHILNILPFDSDYYGIDTDSRYIAYASRKFGNRGHFSDEFFDASSFPKEHFDIIMLNGVLHHLDDATATNILADASVALRPNGKILALDGCFRPGQSRLETWLLENDRGKHVRTEKEYLEILRPHFSQVTTKIRSDISRVPYTFIYSIASHS
jgi:SAM-dependent methyltransferase